MAQHKFVKRAATSAIFAVLLGTMVFTDSASSASKKADGVKTMLVKRQYKKAAVSLAIAAKAGDAKAQYQLASLYRMGLGVSADNGKAAFWFEKAAAQGHGKAARSLKRLKLSVAPTEKKPALRTTESVSGNSTDILSTLPPRDVQGQNWLVMAAARDLTAAVTVLSEENQGMASAALLSSVQANRPRTAIALLHAGTDLQVSGPRGDTPLTWAGRTGREQLLNDLLASASSAGLQGDVLAKAIARAVGYCNANAVQQLLAAKPTGFEIDGSLAVDFVRLCKEPAGVLAKLDSAELSKVDSHGRNSLWHAAYRTDPATLTSLLATHIDPISPDKSGFTAIHAAALAGKPENLAFLLAASKGVAPASAKGISPLMLAAAKGCNECIKLLLPVTTDLDAKDRYGNTAMMYAAHAAQSETYRALLKAGANADARNENSDTPGKAATRLWAN